MILSGMLMTMVRLLLQVKELVADQTKEWTDMVMRHLAEVYELLKSHIQQQTELLRQLMTEVQAAQVKDLDLRNERSAQPFYSLTHLLTVSLVLYVCACSSRV